MQTNRLRAGILGAGLGSRLQSSAGAKPLAGVIDGLSLLDLLLARFRAAGVSEVACALRAEQMPPERRASLPQQPGLSYLFADTASSLHTLAELVRHLGTNRGPVLFSMADTVMLPEDFSRFLRFCQGLSPQENAVLLTTFVDDEKPLWAQLGADGRVTGFGSTPTGQVTSGMYLLQGKAMEMALLEVAQGTHKMRNFLSKLVESGEVVKSFVVAKTIDVDHPSDLQKATDFLRSTQGKSS